MLWLCALTRLARAARAHPSLEHSSSYRPTSDRAAWLGVMSGSRHGLEQGRCIGSRRIRESSACATSSSGSARRPRSRAPSKTLGLQAESIHSNRCVRAPCSKKTARRFACAFLSRARARQFGIAGVVGGQANLRHRPLCRGSRLTLCFLGGRRLQAGSPDRGLAPCKCRRILATMAGSRSTSVTSDWDES